MSPEEATKFKKQIQYFTEHPDDGILVKHGKNKYWELVKYPNWCIEHKYVIPDEYQDLRMALADGKQIEAKEHDASENCWITIPYPDFNSSDKLDYRIKPEEYKFQIGDWVNAVRDDGIILLTKKFTQQDDEFSPPNGYVYELWVPKVGEWIACHDDYNEAYTVWKFKKKTSKWFDKVEPLEAIELLKDK